MDEDSLSLLDLAKKQTLLYGIIWSSSILNWALNPILCYGYFCFVWDANTNISCIFLSLGYTKDFYSKLKCDKFSEKLCGCVERYVISKLDNKENATAMKQ